MEGKEKRKDTGEKKILKAGDTQPKLRKMNVFLKEAYGMFASLRSFAVG